MKLSKKSIIIMLILISTIFIVGSVCAHDISAKNTDMIKKVNYNKIYKVKVKIHNFKSGELWAPKAVKLKNGDAIAGYVEYKKNSQFGRQTGVSVWYVGTGNEDINPHFTKLVKAKFYFKNKKTGKVITKTVKSKGTSHISTKLINGYKPYKAYVWYKNEINLNYLFGLN